MLPAASRMRGSTDFLLAIRSGARAGGRRLVVHVGHSSEALPNDAVPNDAFPNERDQPLVGFVVSRAVGNAVVRTRVKRRLRHQSRLLVDTLPSGARVVVRALPAAAESTSAELGRDLERTLAVALRSAARRGAAGRSATAVVGSVSS